MYIAEILSQDAGGTAASIMEKMEMQVTQVEQLLPMVSPENTLKLRDFLMRLASCKSLITEDQKLLLWKLSYRLWNSCVDMANAMHAGQHFHEEHAKIRQVASDLLLFAGKIDGIPSCLLKIATFFHRTGVIWHKIQKYEVAASCFEKATELVSEGEGSGCESEEERKFSFELLVARAKTAWEMKQRTLTCTLLGRAKGFLFDAADRYRDLAEQYLHYGKCMLAKSEEGPGSSSDQSDYVKFLNQAFEICSEALFKGIGKPEERALAKNLKLKTLRYLAAAHLQAESFESVLKCVAVLREESDHPTTPFLSLKAYVGLGMREAAEKELNVLLLHAGAPVDICISAVEIVIQSGSGGLETARSAFFRLVDRFPSSEELPLRVLDKILRNVSAVDQSYKAKVALALQIACDDKIVRLFADSEDEGSAEKRRCVHAILWNSGSEFFRAKVYDTSILLFEGSMLYLPLDAESSACRAKSLRVLCLCHLGLSQYDRANEFIMEAEKIEATVICLFLKFKICLQLKDEAGAIKQLDRMICCTDFDAEYLTLASHEAIACKSISVATSALTNLLKLCSSGKLLSTKEVVVVRNIILLHLDDPNALSEVLKYFNYAKKRMQELGVEQFFGTGITVEKEINWFAGSAWNSGLKASKSNKFHHAADLFSCASEFYGALEDSVENLKMLSKSLILSIASMLTSQKKDTKNHLTEAVAHLDKARKVQASLASKNEKPDESLQMYSAVLEFEIRGCMREHKLQLQILKQCTTMKGCKPEFLLKMGFHACQSEGTPGENGHLEVASTALNACLHMELSNPFPDYKMVSLVIRKLIGIADAKCEEEVCLGLYKQAHQIIIGMKSGEYPTEEAKWLASTAWNRSGLHVRFNRLDEAEKWMRMGLDLVKHVPFMHQRFAATMADTLAKLINPST